MTRTIRELMTDGPRTATPDDDVATAARRMRDEDAGALPVVEGERLVGMLTDRDVVVRVVAEGRDPASTRVGEVASRRLVTIDPQQDADEALRLMAQHQVRRLPVVEEDGKLVGVVAQADMAREADPTSVGEAVDRISR
jgi:CBS domain-containing protein